MYKIPVSYPNPFTPEETVRKDIYFNLNLAEVTRYQLSGGLTGKLRRLEEIDKETEEGRSFVYDFFEELIRKSFGERSSDGIGFVKNRERQQQFMDSEDYSQCLWYLLFEENATDNAAAFINNLFPAELMAKAAMMEKAAAKNGNAIAETQRVSDLDALS